MFSVMFIVPDNLCSSHMLKLLALTTSISHLTEKNICQVKQTDECVFVVVMLAGPENPALFRPPSSGAPRTAGHSRTELPQPEQPSLVEVLHDLSLSGREELFFMQLPDCMPSRTPEQKVDSAHGSTADNPAKKEGKPEDKRPVHGQVQVS